MRDAICTVLRVVDLVGDDKVALVSIGREMERLLVQLVTTDTDDARRIAAELRIPEDQDLASGFPAGTHIWSGTVGAEPHDIRYVIYARSSGPAAPGLRNIP
jgi:hypothetical protein